MKTTAWYPGTVKPVRMGIYQRVYESGTAFCWWNGGSWSMGYVCQENAKEQKNYHSFLQCLPWRGLREKAR